MIHKQKQCLLLSKSLSRFLSLRLEWGEEEWVSSVLESEDTEEEAVHQKDNGGPGHDGNSLCFGIGYAWDLDGEGDGCKGENTIWTVVSTLYVN